MAHEQADYDQGKETHFWVACPGCGYDGKIGVPHDYAADVVVCPKCRQVVRVRAEDRLLWRPGDPVEFFRRQFPYYDWEAVDQRDRHTGESSADREEVNARGGQTTSEHVPPTASDCPDESGDRRVAPGHRCPARSTKQAPRASRPSSTRRTASGLLDNEVVQFGLILAAGILPLALAIFVPRAMEAVRVGNRAPTELAREAARNAPSQMPGANEPVEVRLKPTSRPAENDSAKTSVKPPAASEPATPDVIYRRGKERRAKGEYLAAVCDFDAVLRAKPEFAWCYYDRAGAYTLMGNQQAALDDLDRAIAAMPFEPKVWRARAVVHHRMHKLKAAVADIWHAVELTQRVAGGGDRAFARLLNSKADMLIDELFEHATALVKSGQSEAAIGEFAEVLKRRPDCASAWLRRGLAYDLSGQYAKALDDLNVALSLRPGPPQAFKLRSTLHERNEDYASALADMRAAQRLDPSRPEYAGRIRWLRSQQRQQDGARQIAIRWRLR